MDPFLEDEPRGGKSFDPLMILRMFWRRKWLFLVPFILCLAMAAVAIRTMTPIYESLAQIRVIHDLTNSRLIDDEFGRGRNRDREIERQTLSTIWTIMTSPKFLESVVRETKLYAGTAVMPAQDDAVLPEVLTPEEMEWVKRRARRLGGQIRVNPEGGQIFEIGVRDPDPRQAYILTRVMLDRFLEEERASRMAPRTSTRDFLSRQRVNYVESLRAAEDSLRAFRNSLLAGTEAGNPINASNLTQAESSLLRMRNDFTSTDVNEMARLERTARTVVSELPDLQTILRDSELSAVVDELSEHIYDSMVGVGRDVRGLDAAAGQARIRLNDLCERWLATRYPQIGRMDQARLLSYVYFLAHREAKRRAIAQLSRYISDYRDFTVREPVQSAQLADLEEEVERRREMLESIDREISQQDLNLEARASEIGYRIEVRRDPEQGESPVEPDRMRLYFMGFALSLAIGFGLVVLSILLDRTFTSVQEIESSLDLAVIGTLPVIQDAQFARKRRLRLLRWITLVVLILGVAGIFLLYVYPRIT